VTSDLREEMDKAVRDSIKQLAKIRGTRFVDAALAISTSYAENLRDSRGTTMEDYWQKMVSVADGIAAYELGERPGLLRSVPESDR
jgi:hypothetical protein